MITPLLYLSTNRSILIPSTASTISGKFDSVYGKDGNKFFPQVDHKFIRYNGNIRTALPDRLSKLVDAINRVGIQNVAFLSRLTGMPTETIRYTIKKRFPELGLSVGMHVDYGRLGLEVNFAVLDFPQGSFDKVPELLKRLSKAAFLMYHCHEALRPSYVAMFGVPVVHEEKFRYLLKKLVDEKVLSSFKLKRLEWTRYLALRSEYYDYKKGGWSIDWRSIEVLQEPPPEPPLVMEPPARPQFDTTDILLIKELEIQSWTNISDIARKLGINERTARWHYSKHVSPMINSYYVHRLTTSSKELPKIGGLIFEFESLSRKNLGAIRRLFNNFPFTWNESGRKDGYYRTVSTIPSEHLMESLRFLTKHLQEHVSQWNTYTLDLTTSRRYTMPYENFNDKVGWFFDEEKALKTVLAIVPEKKG